MTKILVLLLLFSIAVYGQISPGDLTKHHAILEGLSNCTKCHNLGEQLTKEKCIGCHKEIKIRMDKNSGYHSSDEVKNKDCWKCHSEHNGRNFEIIRFDKNKFDHSKTKFILTGAHQNLQCEKCHKQESIKDNELKKRKNTYLGLSQRCADCHEDYHQQALGDNCSGCHNTVKFRPALLFDHMKTKFSLTGAHLKVACDKCHVKEMRNGKVFQKFTGLVFKNCSDCHTDFHKGKFGNDCQKCHVTSDFNLVNKTAFDHSKTNYALAGMHASVECSKCHGNNLSSKPAHDYCNSCHKDFHKGQFKKNDRLIDCAECHTVQGFSQSLFTIEKHAKTKFELIGSHLAATCKTCHKTGEDWNFKLDSSKCVNCHMNIHKNEISQKFMGNSNCESCHNPESWSKVIFDHDKTEFKLIGIHKRTECSKCHLVIKSGEKNLLFSSLSTNCESCHKDIHLGQFGNENKTDCSKCHTSENWKPVKFDHASTRFPLDGAHRNVECRKCHKPEINNQRQFINYKIREIKCAACHSS